MMHASAITDRVVRRRLPLSPGSLSRRSCMVGATDNVPRRIARQALRMGSRPVRIALHAAQWRQL
jgi:hypothetical protein